MPARAARMSLALSLVATGSWTGFDAKCCLSPGFEAVRLDEDREMRGGERLPAQFLGRPHRVGGNRFLHFSERGDGPAKGARGHDAFAVGRVALEIEARHAAEFQHQALDHDAETLADEPRVGLLQCQRRRDAEQIEPSRKAPGDTPEIGELHACECLILRRLIEQQHHAPVFLIPLCDVIGDLRERLAGRDADRDRNAGPLSAPSARSLRAWASRSSSSWAPKPSMPRKASSIE